MVLNDSGKHPGTEEWEEHRKGFLLFHKNIFLPGLKAILLTAERLLLAKAQRNLPGASNSRMENDQWSFWLLAWARGHFLWSKNEVVKQLSMNTCPTSINSTHAAPQPCRRIAAAKHHSTSCLLQGARRRDSHITKFTQSLVPQESQAFLSHLPVIHAESWSGWKGEYGILLFHAV